MHQNVNLDLDGYLPIFRRDRGRGDEPWGGVALYVSNDFVAIRKEQFELDSIELLCVELTVMNCKTILCVSLCYRPPNARVEFWEELQFTYDLITQAGYKHIIIIGDLNADPRTNNGTKLQQFGNSNT